MVIKKPSVTIYTNRPQPEIIYEICSGIEEEGIFYQVISREELDLEELTYEAAADSILGSGIGVYRDTVAFQIKGLSKGQYIFSYKKPEKEQSRILGSNSARAVKKLPFKEREETHEDIY